MSSKSSIVLVILAAGASRRLGRPKQLLDYQDTTLLQRVIDLANNVDLPSKLLVLGAYADKISDKINAQSLEVVINPDWKEGIASSVRVGLSRIKENHPSIKHILFLLSDQPYLTADHLEEMISKHQDDQACITGSYYANQVGVPVIFSHHYFDELLSLKGDQGAKKIVMRHPESTQSIPFKKGEIDIDTKEDYKELLTRKS